jgi:anaerobic selenocysteine-containing dehydrogenase
MTGEQAHGAQGITLEGGNPPDIDNSMKDEHCVLQLLRRHFARYAPQLVSEIRGCAAEDLVKVARALCQKHPGLDGHPDALRRPVGIHPDAAGSIARVA